MVFSIVLIVAFALGALVVFWYEKRAEHRARPCTPVEATNYVLYHAPDTIRSLMRAYDFWSPRAWPIDGSSWPNYLARHQLSKIMQQLTQRAYDHCADTVRTHPGLNEAQQRAWVDSKYGDLQLRARIAIDMFRVGDAIPLTTARKI